MAKMEYKITADVSDAVKGNKAFIKILRTVNQELRTMEALIGTGNTIIINMGGTQ